MKGGHAYWSVEGDNRLAHYFASVFKCYYSIKHYKSYESFSTHLSATKAPQKDGKGYEAIKNVSISSGMKWLKNISACKPLTDLLFQFCILYWMLHKLLNIGDTTPTPR